MPAVVVGARGGRKVIWTVPEASGKREIVGRIDRRPGLRGAENLDSELVDDSARVLDLEIDRNLAARVDGEIGCGQRGDDPMARVYRRDIAVDSQFPGERDRASRAASAGWRSRPRSF